MLSRNTAQKLYQSLGVDIALMYVVGSSKLQSHTKSGPGRIHKQGKNKE